MDLKTATATLTWVCPCCLQKLANDDTSGCEFYCEPIGSKDHPVRWLELYGDDVEITLGMLWSEHEQECPNRIDESWSVECDCERLEFSRRPCDGCGTHLSGERHAVTMWSEPECECPDQDPWRKAVHYHPECPFTPKEAS